ncbi:hypothetical protein NPIL_489801, partial [Nephila pilipes]
RLGRSRRPRQALVHYRKSDPDPLSSIRSQIRTITPLLASPENAKPRIYVSSLSSGWQRAAWHHKERRKQQHGCG